MNRITVHRIVFLVLVNVCQFAAGHTGGFLVQDGKPLAEIVIADTPPRMTRLAAIEMQRGLEKLSGARLAITNHPGGAPVQIYIGRSPHTDKLGVEPYTIKDGGYRIVSGKNWLALLGCDDDYTPVEPWSHSNGDWTSGRVQKEWEAITGAAWGNPMAGHYKNRVALPLAPCAVPLVDEPLDPKGNTLVWAFDERGSFNAVCGFLRQLGMRWYMPGELGEVVTERKTIPLPERDLTVHPAFPVRQINFRFAIGSPENALWAMRLGLRDEPEILIPHGLVPMTDRKEILEAHPDWFALYGGKRQNDPEIQNNQLCYSNPELIAETVAYVRALFDHYDFKAVSVMPPDGYSSICQCELCQGKDTPERGPRGALSDYIWEFVNRVAKEVAKTHPDKWVCNCAYGIYTLPPEKIQRLEPNVLVCIVGGRRPMSSRPEQQEEAHQLREAWRHKTDNKLLIFENYPLTDRGFYFPAFTPYALGNSVQATKEFSMGEDIWLSMGSRWQGDDIALNHFMVYFTARMYWDSDVKVLFDDYCRLFYGPAAERMKAFFLHCEAHWQDMDKDLASIEKAFALFDTAQTTVPAESLWGRRLAPIDSYLNDLRNKCRQLAQKRGRVPLLRLLDDAQNIVIDGVLDEPYWEQGRGTIGGTLREIQTGRLATYGTSFRIGWRNNESLYLAIRCEDSPDAELNTTMSAPDDPALWQGDAVALLLETDQHSYYEIAVNPAGVVCDADWGTGDTPRDDWDSQAEVVVQKGSGYWTVEMRIPITQDQNDPLHQVIGRKPMTSLPWHLNVVRQRVRPNGTEVTAFSPTGAENRHVPLKFGHFYFGHSHTFEAVDASDDFLDVLRAAEILQRNGKIPEALEAFAALAEWNVTALQKAYVLQTAASCARRLRKFDQAAELAARIPLQAMAHTATMQTLLDQRQPQALIEKFGQEPIAEWPFWQQTEGYFARGCAWSALGKGAEAEADLVSALAQDGGNDPVRRDTILKALADNRATNLHDPSRAIEALEQLVEKSRRQGSGSFFAAVLQLANLHSQASQHTEAQAALARVGIDTTTGYWRVALLLGRASAFAASGELEAARADYKAVLDYAETSEAQRRQAEELLAKLTE